MIYIFIYDIRFNFQQGIPFIKNSVLSHVLLTSCNLVRLQSLQYFQKAYVSRANTYKPWRQTYRYTNGFWLQFLLFFLAVLQRVMLYNEILLKVAGIRLIVMCTTHVLR